jgi:hypothetical protein
VAEPPAAAGASSERGAAERLVLLEAAAARLRGEPSGALRNLAAGASDMAALTALAHAHGLLPVLLDAIEHAHPPVELDAGARHELRTAAGGAALQCLTLTAELLRLLDAMAAAGVRALAYKGPALAVQAYGTITARRFNDLDILVLPEAVEAAARVLARAGYRAMHEFTPAEERVFRRTDGDYPFVHATTGAVVELHCRVSSERFLIDLPTPELMERAEQVILGGRGVSVPCEQDHVLVLALHGAKHRWQRLEWLLGFALLAQRAAAHDSAGLLREAERRGGRRVLLLGFELSRLLLGLDVAPPVAAALGRESDVRALAAALAQELPRPPGSSAGADANLLFNLRLKDRLVDRTRYIARWLLVPTPEDWKALPLPSGLHPLYALVRPIRLLWRYAPRPGRRN